MSEVPEQFEPRPPESEVPQALPADPYAVERARQERKLKRFVLTFAVTIVVISGLLFVTFLRQSNRVKTPPMNDGAKGKPAPEFTLKDTSGKVVRLSDFRGKAVVLNFWATWCAPCREEMPWFVEMQNRYGTDGLAVIGVSMDDDLPPAKVAEFVQQKGINYTILIGNDETAKRYGGIDGLPTTFYIDRRGNILDAIEGLPERSEMELHVKQVLAVGRSPISSDVRMPHF